MLWLAVNMCTSNDDSEEEIASFLIDSSKIIKERMQGEHYQQNSRQNLSVSPWQSLFRFLWMIVRNGAI